MSNWKSVCLTTAAPTTNTSAAENVAANDSRAASPESASSHGLDILMMAASSASQQQQQTGASATPSVSANSTTSHETPARPTLPSIRSFSALSVGSPRPVLPMQQHSHRLPSLPSIMTNPMSRSGFPSPTTKISARSIPSPFAHIKSPYGQQHQHLSSPPLSNASPISSYSSLNSASPTSGSASHSYPASTSQQQSPTGRKERTCASCFADYSSGNWYKDKERPGAYMCKSCYVCLNRKKRKSQLVGSAVTAEPYNTSAPLSPTSPRVAMLQVRQRRKPSTGATEQVSRVCVGCSSTHSSGDWYKNRDVDGGFNCQKCYQRLNREKVKRRTEEWLQQEFQKRSLAPAHPQTVGAANPAVAIEGPNPVSVVV